MNRAYDEEREGERKGFKNGDTSRVTIGIGVILNGRDLGKTPGLTRLVMGVELANCDKILDQSS